MAGISGVGSQYTQSTMPDNLNRQSEQDLNAVQSEPGNLPIGFDDPAIILSEDLLKAVQAFTVTADTPIEIEIGEGAGTDIQLTIDEMIDERAFSRFSLFDDKFPVKDYLDAIFSRREPPPIEALAERYAVVWNKIEQSEYSEKSKAILRDNLNKQFKFFSSLRAAPTPEEQQIQHVSPETYKEMMGDFADNFIEAFAETKDPFKSAMLSHILVNKKWGMMFEYISKPKITVSEIQE